MPGEWWGWDGGDAAGTAWNLGNALATKSGGTCRLVGEKKEPG